jgi:hypothetical protein
VRMDRLDTKRKGVKCDVCHGKLAVQCNHSRCMAAIHPHCMMEEAGGFSWRVVELPNGAGYRREAFCQRHADDVGLPLKKEGELLIQVRTNPPYCTAQPSFLRVERFMRRHRWTRTRSSNGTTTTPPC